MQFIRQNIILVVIVAILVVGAGILLAVLLGGSTEVAGLIKSRVDLSDQITNLRSTASAADCSDLEQRRQQLTDSIAKVAEQSSQWNRRYYAVLQLQPDTTGQKPPVAAFPFNRTKYDDLGLYFPFGTAYRAQIADLLKSMGPTELPSVKEVEDAVKIEQARLEQEAAHEAMVRDREAASQGAAPATPTPTPMPMPMTPLRPMGVGVPVVPNMGAMGASADLGVKAKQNVMRKLQIEQASKGRIYATLDALDNVFAPGVVTKDETQLWAAQINLWVQKDIIESIVETNAQVGGPKGNVLNSAIKRLTKVDVTEKYYIGQLDSTVPGGAPAPGNMMPTPGGMMGGGPGMVPGPGGMMGGGPGMVPGPVGMIGGGPNMMGGDMGQTFNASGTGRGLTQRICTKEYDVVRYSFTVTMPTRYVVTLQKNLMKRNYHTILKVDMVASQLDNAVMPYYYGADPVMDVTFQGELLLLTGWERGTFNTEKAQWISPPLMPVEALKTLPTDALRPEDQQLISSSAAAVTPR